MGLIANGYKQLMHLIIYSYVLNNNHVRLIIRVYCILILTGQTLYSWKISRARGFCVLKFSALNNFQLAAENL